MRFWPPGRRATKAYGESTLQRGLYAYRRGGLAALRPEACSDRGRGRELTPEQRKLLLDIRHEHPGASVPLILRTLVFDDSKSCSELAEVDRSSSASALVDGRAHETAIANTSDSAAPGSAPVTRPASTAVCASS